jgi:Putative transposase
LRQSDLFQQAPPSVWRQSWVVHSQPIGSGLTAFKYLAPYIFRVAISNARLTKLENGQVTFRYKDSATKQTRFATVSATEFIRRFLQHVLPNRFVKVRYYGLLSPAYRPRLALARQLLSSTTGKLKPERLKATAPLLSCPHCGGPLILLASLAPRGRAP